MPLTRTLIARLALAAASTVLAATAMATELPAGFSERTVTTALASPTAMALAPDGRILVCEQRGTLRVIAADGALREQPFVSIAVDATGERGLLGVATDPQFAANGRVYVHYTATTPVVHNRISRFTADGDRAVPGSEEVLVDLDPLDATRHNGGAIHFGPDGRLYVAVGDNAVGAHAQTLTNRFGKILRYDADGGIPADNPFVDTATGAARAIWAMGLRNPFTFAFHPDTGRMLINDVGQDAWEEIDDGRAGANYGWPATEGPTTDPRFRAPLHAYGHDLGCSIAGGVFYAPATASFPASYSGRYFFADFCGGWIRTLDPETGDVDAFASGTGAAIVDLLVDHDGALLVLDHDGALRRIAASTGGTPGGTTGSGGGGEASGGGGGGGCGAGSGFAVIAGTGLALILGLGARRPHHRRPPPPRRG